MRDPGEVGVEALAAMFGIPAALIGIPASLIPIYAWCAFARTPKGRR